MQSDSFSRVEIDQGAENMTSNRAMGIAMVMHATASHTMRKQCMAFAFACSCVKSPCTSQPFIYRLFRPMHNVITVTQSWKNLGLKD